jgi:hypothetical protein
VRREVFDLLGPAARGAGRVPAIDDKARLRRGLALLGETEILPLVCQLSEPFVDDLAARNASELGKSLVGLLRSATVTPQQAAQASDLPPLPSRLYSLALVRHSANPRKDDLYFDRPNLFTLHQVLGLDDGPSAAPSGLRFGIAIDIVANDLAVRRAVTTDEARRARLAQGVLDTAAETVLLDDGVRAGAVSDALAARPDPSQWLVVRDAAAAQWKQAQVPPDVRARVEADLAAGYVAVVPLGAADAVATRPGGIGWWRVDPKGGSALGMSREGWGTAMVERAGLMLIVWGACWAGSAAAGKVGAGHDGRQAAACAFIAVGFAVLAPLEAAKAALFVGAVATGLGGSLGL